MELLSALSAAFESRSPTVMPTPNYCTRGTGRWFQVSGATPCQSDLLETGHVCGIEPMPGPLVPHVVRCTVHVLQCTDGIAHYWVFGEVRRAGEGVRVGSPVRHTLSLV